MAQAAVGRAVDDAVTVALEGRAVGVLVLRVAAPARVGAAHGIAGQRCCLLPLYLLAPTITCGAPAWPGGLSLYRQTTASAASAGAAPPRCVPTPQRVLAARGPSGATRVAPRRLLAVHHHAAERQLCGERAATVRGRR